MSGAVSEFTVRAAGADRSIKKLLLGKFPTETDLRNGGAWRLAQEAEEEGGSQEWTLENGTMELRGISERGLAGSGPSNYFILLRHKGDFVAVPVDEWATFKPVIRRGEVRWVAQHPESMNSSFPWLYCILSSFQRCYDSCMNHLCTYEERSSLSHCSLEDAEALMKHQRLQAERINPRLTQALGVTANAPGGAGAPKDDEADSDEEWKDIKARAASMAAVRTAPAARRGPAEGDDEDGGAGGEEGGEGVYVPRPRDAEDWEHETEAADDDLDMGDGSEGEVEASPTRQSPAVSDSEGEGDPDMDAAKVKRTIRKMLRETGLEGSDEGSEGSEGPSGDDDDDDEDDDIEDLDKMASEVLPSRARSRSPGAGEGQRKRKSPPPGEAPAAVGPEAAAALKKQRVQSQPQLAAVATPVGAPPGAGAGPPTEAEVIEVLRSRAPLTVKAFSEIFKARIKAADEKKAFSELIKRVATLVPNPEGGKNLVLKQ